ncbi:MAG TPA: hypothetical protein PLB87_06225 [Prolixibacteraceae bacterium]|nr:hypothetical protein [Prolixibacteraceae bacterium]
MKLKINLEKIKCIKDTFGIGKDEIYLAFFVTCTDKNNPANTKAIKALTNINYKITDGSVFEPVFESNNTRDFEFVFDTEIVNEDNWFITDNKFESMLLENKETYHLATWLYSRQHYELVDYIWLISNDIPGKDLYEIERLIEHSKFEKPRKSSFYFFWTDKKLISREVSVNLKDNSIQKIGINSYSLLVSLIDKSEYRRHMLRASEASKRKWRKDIYNYVKELMPQWNFSIKIPSDYNENFFNTKIAYDQLSLFK